MDLSSFLPGLFNAGLSAYTANQAAGNLQQAGQAAAQQAAFRPVGITTRFGRTGFQYGPDGRLIGAGYQLAPDVAAMREGLLGLSGRGLQQAYDAANVQQNINQQAAGLFNLGAGYLAQTPQQAAQQYMTQQQQLLAPGREQQLTALMNQQFQKGRGGLAVGATREGYSVQPSYAPMTSPVSNFQLPMMGQKPSGPMMTPEQVANMPGEYDLQSRVAGGTTQPMATTGEYLGSFDSPGRPIVGPMPPEIASQYAGSSGGLSQPSFGMATTSQMPMSQTMVRSPGLQATNPQMAAYYNAMAQQDAALAAQAQQAGMRQAEFGQGLLGGAINLAGKGYGLQQAALSPFQTSFGLGQMVEQAGGATPLEMSRVLGGGSPASAQALLTTGTQAAGIRDDYLRGAVRGLNDPIAQLIGALTRSPTNPIMANANPYLDQQNFNALMAYGGL